MLSNENEPRRCPIRAARNLSPEAEPEQVMMMFRERSSLWARRFDPDEALPGGG